MSDPQLVNAPVWIHECQHITISPSDSCQPCAEIAQALEGAVKAIEALPGEKLDSDDLPGSSEDPPLITKDDAIAAIERIKR